MKLMKNIGSGVSEPETYNETSALMKAIKKASPPVSIDDLRKLQQLKERQRMSEEETLPGVGQVEEGRLPKVEIDSIEALRRAAENLFKGK
jgi:hypothetical protein